MSERKINLEEIILDVYGCKNMDELRDYMGEYGSVAMIKDCMKEAIKKALELAAENVVLEWNCYYVASQMDEKKFDNKRDVWIDKQSILNTINQIE